MVPSYPTADFISSGVVQIILVEPPTVIVICVPVESQAATKHFIS